MSFSTIVKATGPAAGSCGLYALGAWGSQYINNFSPVNGVYAEMSCLGLMYIGGLLAIAQIASSAARTILVTWRGSEDQKSMEAKPVKRPAKRDPS